MTPKEKAIELIKKFIAKSNSWNMDYVMKTEIKVLKKDCFNIQWFTPKDCAIVAVDEIIEQWEYIDTYIADLGGKLNPNLKYWQEVKKEIEKL
jgi:hypothetical protein